MIVPVASSIYLADGTIGYPGGKTDLVGVFNRINANTFPHRQNQFVVYSRLVQGQGRVPFHIEIVDAVTLTVIHTSPRNILHFPHRDRTIELAMTFLDISFPAPSTYLIQLWCDATQWVAEARLILV